MGTGPSTTRRFGCILMIVGLVPSLLAQDMQGAMLYGKGSVWVNGKEFPGSASVQAGDTIETEASSAATITQPGSSAVVQESSLAKFEGNSVDLQRGTVNVSTTKSMQVHAGKITATPVSADQTDFEMSNLDGKVHVAVQKGTVEVNCGKQVTNVQEGQDVTPDDLGHCKKGAYPTLSKGPLASPWLWGGVAATGGIIGIIIATHGGSPASPSAPGP